jgi:hypothetical protein
MPPTTLNTDKHHQWQGEVAGRAFIGGITVRPDTGVLDLQLKKLPALVPGSFTCEVVAGARYG